MERSHEQLLDELRKLNVELEQRVIDRTKELEVALGQLQQKTMFLEKMALTDPLTGSSKPSSHRPDRPQGTPAAVAFRRAIDAHSH